MNGFEDLREKLAKATENAAVHVHDKSHWTVRTTFGRKPFVLCHVWPTTGNILPFNALKGRTKQAKGVSKRQGTADDVVEIVVKMIEVMLHGGDEPPVIHSKIQPLEDLLRQTDADLLLRKNNDRHWQIMDYPTQRILGDVWPKKGSYLRRFRIGRRDVFKKGTKSRICTAEEIVADVLDRRVD